MTDPLKSPYGASVIAAYRSAYTIVGLVKNLYEQVAHPINRCVPFVQSSFNRIVIFVTVYGFCLRMSLAQQYV
jgi:hypothetical protein